MQTIELNNARFFSNHGCMEEEAIIGGEYIVNLSVNADVSKSFLTDDIKDTVDYCQLYDIVKEEVLIRSKLIEHVAGRIMNRMAKECIGIKEATLHLVKVSPPINGDVGSVAIKMTESF